MTYHSRLPGAARVFAPLTVVALVLTACPAAPASPTPTPTAEATATATAEPTETESPEPTETEPGESAAPTPSEQYGSITFEDDFSDFTNGWLGGEESVTGGDNEAAYEDEQLRITSNGGVSRVDSANGITDDTERPLADLDDVSVQVDATLIEAADLESDPFGIFCRGNPTEDGSTSFYAFQIYGDGFWQILHAELPADESPVTERLAEGPSDIVNAGEGETNRVRGDCIGDELTMYVNGEMLGSATDDRLSSGSIGMFVSGDEPPAEATFDDFILREEGAAGADDYVGISDDSGALFVSVPSAWTDVRSGAWTFQDDDVGLSLSASTDVNEWYDTYDVDGIFFAASSSLAEQFTAEELLDQYDLSGDCTFDAREEYTDPAYTGFEDIYTECDGTDTEFHIIAAAPEDASFLVLVQVQIATDEGFEAYLNVINTFVVLDASALP